jgi:transposase-like protein
MISPIEARKTLSKIMSASKADSKQDACYICHTLVTSFCNSHVIPQFILRIIAEDSELLQPSAFLDLDVFKYINLEETKGVRNTGTFHFICRNCDSTYFAEYETPELIMNPPSNKMMAQIAMKNYLMQISKRMFEKALYTNIQLQRNAIENKEVLDETQNLDLRDYDFSYRRAKKIIDNGLKSGYRMMYWKRLPYTTPIVAQSPLQLYKDLEGNVIFDIFNLSPSVVMRDIHINIFPTQSGSVVFLFYHKDDRAYCGFERQFNKLMEDDKLVYINYLVFKHIENFYACKSIREKVTGNSVLSKLFQETHGDVPNFGMVSTLDMLQPYEAVKPNEIPNFLAEEYAVQRGS